VTAVWDFWNGSTTRTGAVAAGAASAEELHLSFSRPVSGLQVVQCGLVRRIARLYDKQGQAQRIATVDQDATIIESHKAAAYYHYEEARVSAMVTVWRKRFGVGGRISDGNVPARRSFGCAQLPLRCCRRA